MLPRDTDAEDFIGVQLARQPPAPYYMAQTIAVQEQALNATQARIEELEREVGSRHSGGLVSSRAPVHGLDFLILRQHP